MTVRDGAGHDGVERHRVAGEALVHPHLGVGRMVDHEQRHVVEEVRLPQVGGDAQVVLAVHRGELVAPDEHAVLGEGDVGGVLGVDAQTQGRAPDEVGDELHPAAVVGEEPRARALEPLLGRDDLVGGELEVGLGHAVGPADAGDVGLGLHPEPEVGGRPGEHLLLDEQARPHLDLAAHPERVDALVAGRGVGAGPDLLPAVAGVGCAR